MTGAWWDEFVEEAGIGKNEDGGLCLRLPPERGDIPRIWGVKFLQLFDRGVVAWTEMGTSQVWVLATKRWVPVHTNVKEFERLVGKSRFNYISWGWNRKWVYMDWGGEKSKRVEMP